MGNVFVQILGRTCLRFCCPLSFGKNCLLLSFLFNISQILYFHIIARDSEIYTEFTTPRKQQTKVGLQKSTENAAEPICCPVLKGQMLWSLQYIFIKSLVHT
jgi:hypothetical protein